MKDRQRMPKLTDKTIESLPVPPRTGKGCKLYPDAQVPGLAVRITANGARAFVLRYRNSAGRERSYTIGSCSDWRIAAARNEGRRLRLEVSQGRDPLGEEQTTRGAPTVAQLAERFLEDHVSRKRASTARDYAQQLRKHVLPSLGKLKVADVTYADIDRLHRAITRSGSPYVANRTLAVLHKMFELAIRWKLRADNPCKGIERNQEHKRQRYLTASELAALTKALVEYSDQQAANIVRLLLLTGCRRGEALSARWADLDLDAGVWTKPAATTKQKREHRLPLSAAAVQLLSAIRATSEGEFVFPGQGRAGYREGIRKPWDALCRAAGIQGARIHDLRHTHASVLASAGLSLPVIGALLGHTQAQTTHRYAHLLDDPLRQATERAAAVITGKSMAEVVRLKGSNG